MQIHFEREGGYAGIPMKYIGETEKLPKKIAENLIRSIKNSGFWDLSQDELSAKSSAFPGADVFSYRLTLSEEGKGKSLSFSDISAPQSLRPLLDILQDLSLKQARK